MNAKSGSNACVFRAALIIAATFLAIPEMIRAQTMTAASVGGAQGTAVWWDVTLEAQGRSIAATQNDVTFHSTNTPVRSNPDGTPDCVVNEELGNGFAVSFLPIGCTGTACNKIRAIINATDDRAALPDHVVLYRCRSDIAATAPLGSHFLVVTGIHTSDPLTSPVSATPAHGLITVGEGCS